MATIRALRGRWQAMVVYLPGTTLPDSKSFLPRVVPQFSIVRDFSPRALPGAFGL